MKTLAFCLSLLLLPWTFAHAQIFPALSGRVVDAADLLPPQEEAALANELAAFETRTERQFVIATIPDLQGYAIADYGYQLGRHWGIGDKERNDGVLLIVAPNDRKVRIEVGYGLEPVLTDALSATIISQVILPPFRDGQYAAGIMAGAQSIIKQLELPEDEARAIAAQAKKQAKSQNNSVPSIAFWIFFLAIFVLPTLLSFFGGGRSGRGPVIWGPGSGGFGGRGGFGGGGFGGGFGGGGGSFGGGGSSGGW